MEQKWGKMVILSLALHVVAFSLLVFAPESMPTRRMPGTIYEVDLVEMARPAPPKAVAAPPQKKDGTLRPDSRKAPSAKRIYVPEKKEKPVVVAKRVLEKKSPKPKKPEVPPSKLIDEAVSRIQKKVEVEKKPPPVDRIAEAVSRIQSQVKTGGEAKSSGVEPSNGIMIQLYRLEIYEKVKSNWSYPVADLDAKGLKGLEAIVVLKVKSDGTIVKYWFEKQSPNAIFNDSVVKAIERAAPMPPFPPGYRKTEEEIEITFDLRDLLDH